MRISLVGAALLLILTASGCSAPKFSADYAVDEMEIDSEAFRPYDVDENISTIPDPRYDVDEQGVRLSNHPSTGERIVHPVSTAQYALDLLAAYDRGDERKYLDQSVANAELLWAHVESQDGAAWFPYPFDFALAGDPDHVIHDPWYSGMAQGQALSLFSRLYEETGEERWEDAAEQTFASFLVEKRDDGPWATMIDEQGRLWFEEYAGDTEPLKVINGHVFAMWGLYDYYRATGERDAAQLFQAGATTVRQAFDEFRVPGETSFYCVHERCQIPLWQNEKYHMVHANQLEGIGKITGEDDFLERSVTLREDFTTDVPLR